MVFQPEDDRVVQPAVVIESHTDGTATGDLIETLAAASLCDVAHSSATDFTNLLERIHFNCSVFSLSRYCFANAANATGMCGTH